MALKNAYRSFLNCFCCCCRNEENEAVDLQKHVAYVKLPAAKMYVDNIIM